MLYERGIGTSIPLTHYLASLPSIENLIIPVSLLSRLLSGYQYTFSKEGRGSIGILYTFFVICSVSCCERNRITTAGNFVKLFCSGRPAVASVSCKLLSGVFVWLQVQFFSSVRPECDVNRSPADEGGVNF